MMTSFFRRNRTGRTRGFSLIELLTVMAIMGLLTTVAVTGYFTAIRGMARRSALKHLAGTLLLARQRACMEGRPVSVFIYGELVTSSGTEDDEDSTVVTPTYSVCRRLGRVSHLLTESGKKILVDEFGGLDGIFPPVFKSSDEDSVKYSTFVDEHRYETLRLYNLSRGGWSDVYTRVLYCPLEDRDSATLYPTTDGSLGGSSLSPESYEHVIPAYGFIVKNELSGNWRVGDAYGFEVESANTLPTGFAFPDIKDEKDVILVTFGSDGTASSAVTIDIRETNSGKTATIRVRQDGTTVWDQSAGAWK